MKKHELFAKMACCKSSNLSQQNPFCHSPPPFFAGKWDFRQLGRWIDAKVWSFRFVFCFVGEGGFLALSVVSDQIPFLGCLCLWKLFIVVCLSSKTKIERDLSLFVTCNFFMFCPKRWVLSTFMIEVIWQHREMGQNFYNYRNNSNIFRRI